jgi:hypothetical protein
MEALLLEQLGTVFLVQAAKITKAGSKLPAFFAGPASCSFNILLMPL